MGRITKALVKVILFLVRLGVELKIPEEFFSSILTRLTKGKYSFAIIDETSMLPVLRPGQIVLVELNCDDYYAGEIVVAKHPFSDYLIVKQLNHVISYGQEDKYFLVGVNQIESIDSRHFGPLTREHMVGKVVVW